MADTGPCANKSQAFAARWVLREESSTCGRARFPGILPGPTLRKIQHLLGGVAEEMCPQSSRTVLFMVSLVLLAQPFTSGKGREAQIRCGFALGQTPGTWTSLSNPPESNLAQLLAGEGGGGGGCMQLPVSMCKTCTQHRLTQPELARGRDSRNRPSGQAWFSEVHCPSHATPLLCPDPLWGRPDL